MAVHGWGIHRNGNARRGPISSWSRGGGPSMTRMERMMVVAGLVLLVTTLALASNRAAVAGFAL